MNNKAVWYVVLRDKDDARNRARMPESYSWRRMTEANHGIVNYEDRLLYAGWEFADKIPIYDYQEAKRMREEYEIAIPSHDVRLHHRNVG